MSWNPFVYLKKSEKVAVCLWDNDLSHDRITCRREGDVVRDLGRDRTYLLAGAVPIVERVAGKPTWVYHLDRKTGAGLRFERSGDLVSLQTTPELLHKFVDSNFLGQLVNVMPGIGMILLAFGLGFFLAGTIFGLFG